MSSRCAHALRLSPSEQNASSPHPANTDNPHKAASNKLATIGITGDTHVRVIPTRYPGKETTTPASWETPRTLGRL
ncbi:hypothetical protein Aple_079310 [Acrocarpospora pleiomorpha]|uniref:Uncharacterized protein n=1 Tax=Acrocarpospora pleiomorpha TaxID=90975 RepID=A0A5M3XVM7_9ACTN|nr:hypothetical protein Aple_079310 [Acrocarpospora pleiomorpha]